MSGCADSYEAIAKAIEGATSIALCAHVDPDGDAVGSSLGLTAILERLGKTVYPLLANGTAVPSTYAFLPGAERLRAPAGVPAYDLFIALDVPDLVRLGDSATFATAAASLVVIDHHPDNRCFGHVNLVDPVAAATGELLWRLLPVLGVTADTTIATCLFTALMTDSGRFSYSNTTPAALRAAAEMIEAGADVAAIFRSVYESRTPGALALIGRALSRMTRANGGDVIYSWITPQDFVETGALPEETENLIDEIRAVKDVGSVALLKVGDGSVRVSLRSKNGHDVGAVARTFGGGGHRAAAGFTREGTLESVLGELLPLLPGGS